MVSNFPMSMPFDNTHMFDFTDLRPCVKKDYTQYCHNSIMDILNKNPKFSIFKYIMKLSGMDLIYDDAMANFTLFVPSDECLKQIPEGVFLNLDIGSARDIIKTHTLKNRITYDLLKDSPISYLMSVNESEKLSITNISGTTTINNCTCIIQPDLLACNGIIHVVNNMIWPYSFFTTICNDKYLERDRIRSQYC
jgi:uncharacterized surface protein with fasciclin (FAS1) repeats